MLLITTSVVRTTNRLKFDGFRRSVSRATRRAELQRQVRIAWCLDVGGVGEAGDRGRGRLTYAAARRAVRRYKVGVEALSVPRRNHNTWTPEQMMVFLDYVQHHRWYALWVLEASTGVRRSELCGVELTAFDLVRELVRTAESTRAIAGGKALKGTGKSQKSRRSLALDSFTCGALAVHFQQMEREKEEWGGLLPGPRPGVLLGRRSADLPGHHHRGVQPDRRFPRAAEDSIP
ncbi:hypothetical protein ACFWN2_26330 [Lentzea sp. NPDC058436]|uniref:hypothetical protein n=1 Tax=Lentzea sp. NPDC058436 TaxID=3346499 RepID=UPI00365CA7B8